MKSKIREIMDILIIFYNSEYFGFLDINLYKLSCISVWPIFVDKNDTIKQFKLYLMLADPSAILVYICNVLYAILFIYNQNCMKWKDYQYKLVIFGWKWRRSIKIYQDQYIPSQKWEVFQFLLLLPFYIVNLGILLHIGSYGHQFYKGKLSCFGAKEGAPSLISLMLNW